ncbi:MAG: FHA domain-containing protein [Williamsia sp.]|nr:FHA domain-containing protein [Williamsia sp.]
MSSQKSIETKTFGRNDANDVVIGKLDVSNFHAKISMDGEGCFFVEDLNSTNGTYVNGYRIRKAKIRLADELRLSENTYLDLRKLFGVPASPAYVKKNPLDFTREFSSLEEVWIQYKRDRKGIIRRHQLKTGVIRSVIVLTPLFVWEVIQALYIDQLEKADPVLYHHLQSKYLPFSAVASSVAVFVSGMLSPMEKLEELDDEFRSKYICPNPPCRNPLGTTHWRVYANQGKCFRCGAIYTQKQYNQQ